MRLFFILCVAACTFSACSSETTKRTTYETLKNIEKQQCDKDLSRDCPERESYDNYQKKRETQ